MDIFHFLLIVATFLCTLVAGFLFSYAVVIMPGLRKMDDRDFIRAFQVTDGIIQQNQPLFIFVWLGSAIAMIAAACFGFSQLQGSSLLLFLIALLAYMLGVQILTIVIHLPLNNQLQQNNIETMNKPELNEARQQFEARWTHFNIIRTGVACLVSFLLIILLYQL